MSKCGSRSTLKRVAFDGAAVHLAVVCWAGRSLTAVSSSVPVIFGRVSVLGTRAGVGPVEERVMQGTATG